MLPTNKKRNIFHGGLITTVIAIFFLFFIDLPFHTYPRSITEAWNLGHILFFFLLVIIYFQLANTPLKSYRNILFVVLLTLILGGLIEFIQSLSDGRGVSFLDMLRNIFGCLLGIAVVYWKTLSFSRRILIGAVLFYTLIIVSGPLAFALLDESKARKEFPVLSSFESKSEVSRWKSATELSLVKDPEDNSNTTMQIGLAPAKYSGVSLSYFPRDWSEMESLTLKIYNPSDKKIRLTFRIHDYHHTITKQDYSDRFNRTITLVKGWNYPVFSLDEISESPATRNMDLQRIYNFCFFISNLKTTTVLLIDDVRLTP